MVMPWWGYAVVAAAFAGVAVYIIVGEIAKRLPRPPHEQDRNANFE